MALHKQGEQFCRELGNPDGLARSLANQAGLLAEKMPLAEEAHQLATDHSLDALAKQIKFILVGCKYYLGINI